MSKHGLVIYRIKITKKDDGKNLYPINTISPTGINLAQTLQDELANLTINPFNNKMDKKISMRKDPSNPPAFEFQYSQTSLFGRINYGFYGDAADIYDDKDNLAFQQLPTHTSMMPMFFELLVLSLIHI